MELLEQFIALANDILAPFLVIGLLGTGAFLIIRLVLVQIRRLGHTSQRGHVISTVRSTQKLTDSYFERKPWVGNRPS